MPIQQVQRENLVIKKSLGSLGEANSKEIIFVKYSWFPEIGTQKEK